MKCPNCGINLLGSMTVCPKCKYDTKQPGGGAAFISYQEEAKSNESVNTSVVEPTPVVEPGIELKEGVIYHVKGVRGRVLDVYEDKAVISVKASIGSFITGNISDGEKTIYYSDCIGVQFKKSGFQIGYLQLETASAHTNNLSNNFFSENSFTFDTTTVSNEAMENVANYVKKRVDDIKRGKNAPVAPVQSISPADELKKYKELLDLDIITQEEFNAKKKQILGL